ncbi:asparagine synthetase B family protein [Dokdonella fugitiva]|uniref:asparagine synthase (glutamine-hydrolyzing) n=1 Tax=Dokdonella fugitiva TaxID=328517 RepID=A0A4R2IF46_9GAMM|nr:asparagine synthase C-terminal domain-containing protein [Dokdonella fugitiva]MBA8883552.1 asparagine synthase (glutamine-hydrolyzing) [Dokdonella fugitiva]TCO41295.1 asparagine synthase (glutamine-hydrolysing) [Dokdonella fugitiva]
MSTMNDPASVIGDFACAFGPAAARAIVAPDGYAVCGDGDVRIATRGAVRRGEAGGVHWFALADLVEGRCADGVAALDGDGPHARWRGRFVQVVWSAEGRRVAALTDHFSTLPLYVLEQGGTVLLASDLRLVLASPLCAREVDPLAIYHYLNFAYVPAPLTICAGVQHVTPGTRYAWDGRRGASTRYWLPEYAEDLRGSDEALARDLRAQIVASVHDYRPADTRSWGCFLSGGTDSSSIVSILASERPEARVRSFSIGFAEEGYDELAYAELVARTVGAEPYTARVSRGDALALLERVVGAWDQPFGDASAVPTLACAALAATQSVDTLLAGDGGDEIYGGNERYAKDQVMEAFHRLPASLKALARGIGRLAGRSSSHFLNRIDNFTRRASLPNPDRFYTDDSFGSDDYDELLTPAFRARVPRDASLEFMREVYALGGHAGPLHRIMRLDLGMAIAQNDLYKVHGACRAHGISARYPYLDPRLVAWTGRLPPDCKVRGTAKRYLFKQAMAGILPEDVLKKKKQGFGLPVAVWLRSDAPFQQFVREVLFDARTLARGVFERAFVERLLAEHARGSWDHSRGIWQLVVLELWLRRHLDAA